MRVKMCISSRLVNCTKNETDEAKAVNRMFEAETLQFRCDDLDPDNQGSGEDNSTDVTVWQGECDVSAAYDCLTWLNMNYTDTDTCM